MYAIGAIVFAATLVLLLATVTSVSFFLIGVSAAPWAGVALTGLLLRRGSRVAGALLLLAATLAAGIVGDHLERVPLVLLGAGLAFIGALAAVYACHSGELTDDRRGRHDIPRG